MQVKKQQLEPDMEQWIGSKLGKAYVKSVYCYPIYFNVYAEHIMWNAGRDESQTESRLKGEIPTTSDMQTIPL